MDFQRARKTEQIEERKQEILKIARELCHEHGVLKWSLNELGRKASVTKSNLYRYFGSREEVLLYLLNIEILRFTELLDNEIEDRPYPIDEFSKSLASQYAKCSFFCELLSVAPTVLEHNVELKPLIEIKRIGIGMISPNARIFMRALKWISEEDAVKLSQDIAIYAAGLWPLAHPASVIRELTEISDFQCIRFDFEEKMAHMISTLLSGCKVRY
jgi:AcrR family transcriptional regulator